MLNESESNQKVLKYLPLVERAAKKVKVKSSDYEKDDLISMGVLGLMDALEKYDDSKQIPFEHYAYIRIKGAIIDEVRKTSRVPRSRLNKLNSYYKAKEKLENEWMRTPTEEEICAELGIDEKQLKGIHETVHMLANVSLDEMLFDEEAGTSTRMEYLEDKEAVGVEEMFLKKEQQALLIEGIKQLTEREQTILQLYYVEELPLKEIAYIYDISIPRVSQIHGKIVLKLREFLQKENREAVR
ncbi:sigma-70 family RNA polymerase sigma factor [Atopococcus tabaci]|uniref:sigma-70 family RNA polymerase sigma factor n=1 Tax=Atopococcus tabaci TaxID=269774 RepID=UPI00041FE2DA|nr:FliA/WhiG family RNA polymerase sigma factor [Atopococcus tabaci]